MIDSISLFNSTFLLVYNQLYDMKYSHFIILSKWLNRIIWTLDGTTTLGQGGAGSNSNEVGLHILQTLELESHHQIV